MFNARQVWAAANWAKPYRAKPYCAKIGVLVAAPGILLSSSIDWLPLAIGGLICFGLAKAFSDSNMMPILCTVTDSRYRATGYGVLNLFSCIIGGLTIYAGGVLRDAAVDVSHVFQFAAASMLVCAALLFCIRPSAHAEG